MLENNYRNNRPWTSRERMNPNAHHWTMATSAQIATLKRQGAAKRQGDRAQNPMAPLEPFHGFPVPYMALLAPHANLIPLYHFVPSNPAFDFLQVAKAKGNGWLHRAHVVKDIPVKVAWHGWPDHVDNRQITTLI